MAASFFEIGVNSVLVHRHTLIGMRTMMISSLSTRLTHLLPLTTTKRTKTGLGPTLMIMRRMQFSQTLDKEQRWKHSSHTQLEQDVFCDL